MNIEVGKRYVVTKGSDDGSFQVGDHIVLCTDGVIECREMNVWLSSDYYASAVAGMEVEIDQAWLDRRKQKLRDELEKLEKED